MGTGTVIVYRIAPLLRTPPSVLLIVLGCIGGYVITQWLDIDTGLRATNFHDLVFFVFLPVLIYEAALSFPLRLARQDAIYIGYLAVVGVMLTAAAVGFALFYLMDAGAGFPLIAGLLTGALLAATDPIAVVAQLNALGAPERLRVLLEGESLFNDATAIAVFAVLLEVALELAQPSTTGFAVALVTKIVGGTLIGGAAALVGLLLSGKYAEPAHEVVTGLVLAYGSFYVAEGLLHVSGILAVTITAFVMANRHAYTTHKSHGTWQAFGRLADGCIFLLMGVTITFSMFEERWLAMLYGIGVVAIIRIVVVLGGLSLLSVWHRHPVPLRERVVVTFGGVRGVVALALALALPVELDYWWTIQSIAFGVVLADSLFMTPLLPALTRRLHVQAS